MKTLNRTDTASFGASFNSPAIHLESMEGYSIALTWTGTGAGMLSLQASNNGFNGNVDNNEDPNATWVDIPGSSIAVASGAGAQFWNVSDVYYNSVRYVWTRTSGTGTVSAYIYAKGIQ